MQLPSANSALNWIGIDVGKDKLDVYELSQQRLTTFRNNVKGIEELQRHLKEQANIAIVCEASGGYETLMVQSLAQQGIRVSLVNPRQVRDFAKTMGKLAKTSGRYQGNRRIWGGRASARTLLYMAILILVAIRHHLPIRAFYEHLRDRGKAKKVALVACMRKFLTCLNTMVRQRTHWQDEKVTAYFKPG